MNEVASFGVMIIVIVLGLFYLLPTFIACVRKTAHSGVIFVINALLGWTILGWLAALIWACTEKQDPYRLKQSAVVAGLVLLLSATANAEKPQRSIEYDFTEIAPTPGFNIVSINSKNEVAGWTSPDQNGFHAFYINQKGKRIEFECGLIQPASLGDTMPTKINDRGEVSGSCVSGTFTDRKVVSFIRERLGLLAIVAVPGADGTEIFGLNNRGQAVGQYYNPLIPGKSGFFRFHGFVYDKGKLTTLDIPAPAGVFLRVTTLFGIDNAGRIIGQYLDIDPLTNANINQIFFLYDNGQVNELRFPGSITTDLQDINSLGTVVGNSNLGPFIWDDGAFYTITAPVGKRITFVDGIDDDGRVLGFYRSDPCPPFPQSCPGARFLATPRNQHGKSVAVDMR